MAWLTWMLTTAIYMFHSVFLAFEKSLLARNAGTWLTIASSLLKAFQKIHQVSHLLQSKQHDSRRSAANATRTGGTHHKEIRIL